MLISWVFRVQKRISFYKASTNHFKSSWIKNTYNRFVNRLVYSFSMDILSNSNVAFDTFFKADQTNDNRFKVVPNGVDLGQTNSDMDVQTSRTLRKKYRIHQNKIIIGHVGRYNEENISLYLSGNESIFKTINESRLELIRNIKKQL